MVARLLVLLLSAWAASAGRLKAQTGAAAQSQTSAAARRQAKERLGGDIAMLASALRRGLAAGAVSEQRGAPSALATMARQRLGEVAEQLQKESAPQAMMLRAFTSSAPDSILIMPPTMREMDLPDGRKVVVVEQEEAVRRKMPLKVHHPHGPTPGEPTVERMAQLSGAAPNQSSTKDGVKEAVSQLLDNMQDVQDRFGKDALQDIVHEFFDEQKMHEIATANVSAAAAGNLTALDDVDADNAEDEAFEAQLRKEKMDKAAMVEHHQEVRLWQFVDGPARSSAEIVGNTPRSQLATKAGHNATSSKAQAADARADAGEKKDTEKSEKDATWYNSNGQMVQRRCTGRHCRTRVMRAPR